MRFEINYFLISEKYVLFECFILRRRNDSKLKSKYPERRQPGGVMFRRLKNNFLCYGERNYPPDKKKENLVVETPRTSLRQNEHTTGVGRSTGHIILKCHKLH